MKNKNRKEYPDVEGFTPEGWEVIEDDNIPDFLREIEEEAREYIRKRGGKRPGSGRPTGTKKELTKQVRLPQDIANWIQSDRTNNVLKIRKLIVES